MPASINWDYSQRIFSKYRFERFTNSSHRLCRRSGECRRP